MTTTSRLRALLATTIASTALVAVAADSPADAARDRDPNWDMDRVVRHYGARMYACKVFKDGGKKVQIFVQLDNTRNRGDKTRSGAYFVYRYLDTLEHRRFGPVPAGRVSKVKSVTVRVSDDLHLYTNIDRPNGDGWSGGIALERVGRC